VNGDLTEHLIDTSIWSDAMLEAAGIPLEDIELVSVGAGLGSFALADTLRIAGVDPARIRVLGPNPDPVATYKYLAENSQIPAHERLRSDSAGTMDNIWGFPSYAWREAAAAKEWSEKASLMWGLFTEPVLSDYYTPKAGQVYESVAREAGRIGWKSMWREGMVRAVRRRDGGGYFTILTPPEGASPTRRIALRSRHVHVAVGYPGLKFLPDLQEYRQKHSDYSRVVNAYEPHDHVYLELRRRPGTVVIRGSGIVASRILQRLIDDRDNHGAQTKIIHLFRNYVTGPQGDSVFSRRPGGNGVANQAFNFPKAALGGQLKDRFEQQDEEGRADLIRQWGGTNTPKRKHWDDQLARGREQGFYVQLVGTAQRVEPGEGQTVRTWVKSESGQEVPVEASFVIDATGLEGDIEEHRIYRDLLEHAGARRNVMGRLAVERTFEFSGTRAEPGRLYASGSATLGGYYPGVDSFVGLQYAALQITDDLATTGFCARIDTLRSISEWLRWVGNKPPVVTGGQR
jgi:pSer/pThr/pTyr-binding forkhead associated (FHA) protein